MYSFHLHHHGFYDASKLREANDCHTRFGYITADHLDGDKVSYAKQASEGKVTLVFPCSEKKNLPLKLEKLDIVGTSFTKGSERIYLGLQSLDVDVLIQLYPESKKADKDFNDVKVTFVLKHSYFNRLHKAIDQLPKEIIAKLLPLHQSDFSNPYFDNYCSTHMVDSVKNTVCLDKREGFVQNPQMFALHKILKSDPSKAPVLIVGSFGTGKTRLLARAAYQILHNDVNAKVLVCAHHQRSVDSLLENYFGKMIKEGWQCKGMVRLIPEGKYSYKQEFEEYYKTLSQVKNLNRGSLQLVLTTFSSSLSLLRYPGKDHFTHILLDEGAQTREPESIAPLCLANSYTKIVIAGDHKQV